MERTCVIYMSVYKLLKVRDHFSASSDLQDLARYLAHNRCSMSVLMEIIRYRERHKGSIFLWRKTAGNIANDTSIIRCLYQSTAFGNLKYEQNVTLG